MIEKDKAAIIKARLQEIRDLPSLPLAADSITRAVLDENSNAQTIALSISKDPSFASRILRVVNSAYYGFYRQITSIKEAVALLGTNEIRMMAMAITVYDLFKVKESMKFNRKNLWMHGVAVAYMADYLQRMLRKGIEEAYVAGLLHDIGKVVLDQFFPDETHEILQLFEGSEMSYLEAEREVLGMDHGELGFLIAERWNLPAEITVGIRYHHATSGEIEVEPAAAIIHLSDYFAWQVGYVGSPDDPPKGGHLSECLKALGLEEDRVESLMVTLKEGFKKLEAFLAAN